MRHLVRIVLNSRGDSLDPWQGGFLSENDIGDLLSVPGSKRPGSKCPQQVFF
jgi:hypothetical protein